LKKEAGSRGLSAVLLLIKRIAGRIAPVRLSSDSGRRECHSQRLFVLGG
jgi:hypothetical protein